MLVVDANHSFLFSSFSITPSFSIGVYLFCSVPVFWTVWNSIFTVGQLWCDQKKLRRFETWLAFVVIIIMLLFL